MIIDVSILKFNMRAHKYNLSLFIDKLLLVLFFLVIVINIASLFMYFQKYNFGFNSFLKNETLPAFPQKLSGHHLFQLQNFPYLIFLNYKYYFNKVKNVVYFF